MMQRILKFEALANISASFELFCLASGMEALGEMMDHDARAICGPRHARGHDRRAHRWGKTRGKIGFHGGKVEIERPRLRSFEGKEQALPSWEAAVGEDWLGKWSMNQMLINVATRKFARSVRLPEGDVPAPAGAGLSKSAVSRRFVALSAARMKEWMASDLSSLDLLVIQIDGIHMDEDLILVAAIGVDAKGDKHPLGLIEGATENAATVQALINNLIERGLDPAVPRLCSSSTARRPCPRRSAGPSELPRRSSAVRSTRLATLWSDYPNRYTLRSGVCCDKHGNLTMPTRPKSCSATSPNVSNETGPGSPARSWKASTRSSPSRGLDCRRSCGARSPAPTLSRT